MIRILLAETDEKLADRYRAELEPHGYDVRHVSDAVECVAQLRDFRPCVLVLDPDIPWGQGEGVLTLLREVPNMPEVTVIVLTSRDREGNDGLMRAGRRHVRHCVPKPVSPTRLAELVLEASLPAAQCFAAAEGCGRDRAPADVIAQAGGAASPPAQ